MTPSFSKLLTPEKALIFRITHRSNVPWTLKNGLHCPDDDVSDPRFVRIGNPELIELRRDRKVDVPPGGALKDYVAFYFTPRSPMLYNIKTGYAGVRQRQNDEIVILVSSLNALRQNGVPYVFTDRHAYLETARFFNTDSDLPSAVDFPQLQRSDFKRDPEHPDRFERYQAEALAHRYVPTEALLGIACYTPSIKDELEATCSDLGLNLNIVHRAEWYF